MGRLAAATAVVLLTAGAACGQIGRTEFIPFRVATNQVKQERNEFRSTASDDWRRTAHGWERSASWSRRLSPIEPVAYGDFIHPAAIACLQLLLSIGALVAGKSSFAPPKAP